MLIHKTVIPTCFLLLLTACASNKADIYAGDDPAYIYAVGHHDLQEGNYNSALIAYQSLDSQYPYTEYTKNGDLESIYAYYQNDKPALAAVAATRYLKIYPDDPHADYAYYVMGITDFDNGRGFLQKYFPYDMSQHNAENYQKAFNYFNIVYTQYPKSPYADDARRRMIYLNNTLAQYNLNVAQFLFEQNAYVAAVNRAQIILLNFPNTPQAKSALILMGKAYTLLKLPDLAQSTAQILAMNFPEKVASSSSLPQTKQE